jgi:hypothetical protein
MNAPMRRVDLKILEVGDPTEQQVRVVKAIHQYKGVAAAARALKMHPSSVRDALRAVTQKAAVHGYSPQHDLSRPVAPGQVLRGASTLYRRGEKEPVLQWVKSRLDEEQRAEIFRGWVQSLSTTVQGLSPLVDPPPRVSADLLAVYPMGDPHFGMYAWAKETGAADFDLDEAERLTKGAIDRLVSTAPPAQKALLLSLGDFFHANSNDNVTPRSGARLDVDSRFQKVQKVGLRAMIHATQRLLERHEEVELWLMPGNHDPDATGALSLMLDCYFHNNPRVTVDTQPGLFKYLRFGRSLIGSHHGHEARMAELPLIMAHDRPADWGATSYRHWYCGHIHHKHVDKEHPGVVVETFRTLAPSDAWHAGRYRAGRDMCLIVHHKEFGEVERHRCDVAMVAA